MIKIPRLLLVGGNSRHIGKTTLACRVIRKFSAEVPIIAVKVTSIYPGDAKYHGHEITNEREFDIIQETDPAGLKDTAKMLNSGAFSAYYIQANDKLVEKAWSVFLKMIPPGHLIVCESRSLRRFVEPGLFIYLKKSGAAAEKPYSQWLAERADLLFLNPVYEQIENITERIAITRMKWSVL